MKTRWLLFLIGCLLLLNACADDNIEDKTAEFFAMDTYITITAYGTQAEAALSEAEKCIRELEGLLSVTDAGSEVYAINHSNGQPVAISEDTEQLIAFALTMAVQTGGALEPTIYPVLAAWGFTTGNYQIPAPAEIALLLSNVDYTRVQLANRLITLPEGMQLDLGAVAKGYAGDKAAEILRRQGVDSAIINLGGNVQLIGQRPDGAPWRIGLQNPNGAGHIGVLAVSDCAVVTSGSYQRYFIGANGQRYHHIIDPASGQPAASGLLSATVITPEGKLGDALSTALFIMGADKAAEYWRQHSGFEMILLTDDGHIILTQGIAADFTQESAYADWPLEVIYYEE